MKKAIFYSSLGGVLEFYDFIIFAIFASAISSNFFPKSSHTAGILLTFTVFAAGYLIRPIGGLIYGHFGDIYGRKKTFTYSIILMALSTLLIAFIPTYQHIGILAPILLTILRLIQGASIGGEIPGAITLISESSVKNKTLGCSILFFSLIFGIILGELVHKLLLSLMTQQNVMDYGWRYAFIIGGILGLWGFVLRRKLSETPLFKILGTIKHKIPFASLLKKHTKEIFIGWRLMGVISAGIMCQFLIMPAYAKFIDMPLTDVFLINTLILFTVTLTSILFGYIGDRVSKKTLILIGLVIAVIFSYTIFEMLISSNVSLIFYTLYSILTFGIAVAIIPSILAELFPTELRYTGVAIVYNLSFATTGGLAPIIIFFFITEKNFLMVPAIYFIVSSLIALFSLLISKKSKNYLEN